MVKLNSSSVFMKDPADVWGKEHTIGNAELAARLGSPVRFDRRGSVLAYDDFNDAPLKWAKTYGTTGGGTGYSITLSNSWYARGGGGSLRLIPPNVVGDWCKAYRYFGGVAKNKIGVEIITTFSMVDYTKTSILLGANTGTRSILAGIRMMNNNLSYLQALDPTADASYTSFNTDFDLENTIPYTMKFVIDVENEKYVRCIFGGDEIDMSSYTPYTADNNYSQMIYVGICSVAANTSYLDVFCDNFILTIEEPE